MTCRSLDSSPLSSTKIPRHVPNCSAVMGCCMTPSGAGRRFSHPPFDLPSGPAPSSPIARPSSDAEQLNPLAQPLPPVPPPPSAITAPGPRDSRAKAVAMTACASESSLVGLQQSVPALAAFPAQQGPTTWDQQQQQHAADAASLLPPPLPPPRRPSSQTLPDAAQPTAVQAPQQKPPEQGPSFAPWLSPEPLQQEPSKQQQQQQPPQQQPRPDANFGFWAQTTGPAQAGLARSSSASAATTNQAISNTDPVVTWNPSNAAPAAEERAPTVAAEAAAAERPAEGPPTQDQIVAPPKRTASLSRLPPASGILGDAAAVPGWAQMGGWGGRTDAGFGRASVAAVQVAGPPAASAAPAAADAFNPFGDNPLHRALAADYRRDPVVAQPARKMPAAGPLLRPKAPGEHVAPNAAALRPTLSQPGEAKQTPCCVCGTQLWLLNWL